MANKTVKILKTSYLRAFYESFISSDASERVNNKSFDHKLGLRYVRIEDEFNFLFQIINEKRWKFAKIVYGI